MITGPLAKFFYIITFNNIKYKNYSDVLVLNLNLEPIPKLSSYKQLNYLPTVQDQDSSHPFFHTL